MHSSLNGNLKLICMTLTFLRLPTLWVHCVFSISLITWQRSSHLGWANDRGAIPVYACTGLSMLWSIKVLRPKHCICVCTGVLDWDHTGAIITVISSRDRLFGELKYQSYLCQSQAFCMFTYNCTTVHSTWCQDHRATMVTLSLNGESLATQPMQMTHWCLPIKVGAGALLHHLPVPLHPEVALAIVTAVV